MGGVQEMQECEGREGGGGCEIWTCYDPAPRLLQVVVPSLPIQPGRPLHIILLYSVMGAES